MVSDIPKWFVTLIITRGGQGSYNQLFILHCNIMGPREGFMISRFSQKWMSAIFVVFANASSFILRCNMRLGMMDYVIYNFSPNANDDVQKQPRLLRALKSKIPAFMSIYKHDEHCLISGFSLLSSFWAKVRAGISDFVGFMCFCFFLPQNQLAIFLSIFVCTSEIKSTTSIIDISPGS